MRTAHGLPPGERPTQLRPELGASRRTCCLRLGGSAAASLAAFHRPGGPHIGDHAPEATAAGARPCCRRPHAVALLCRRLHLGGCCRHLPAETCRAKRRRNAWPTLPRSSEAAAPLRLGGAASRSTGATGWHSLSTPARRTPSATRVSPVSGRTLSREMPLLDLQRAVHDTTTSGTGETARQLAAGTLRSTGTR